MNKARRTKVQAILAANPTLKPKLAYVISGFEFSGLDLKDKVLVIRSDDFDESMMRALRPAVKDAGGLGAIAISPETEMDAATLDEIQKYVDDKREELAKASSEAVKEAVGETPSGDTQESV